MIEKTNRLLDHLALNHPLLVIAFCLTGPLALISSLILPGAVWIPVYLVWGTGVLFVTLARIAWNTKCAERDAIERVRREYEIFKDN